MSFPVQRRDGFYSLRKTARELCRLVVVFTPVIAKLYPSNAALQAALVAANTACGVLVAEIDAEATPGV